MNFGQYVFGGTTVFGPWMKRKSDNATFTYEEIAKTTSSSLKVKVFHKNSEDAGEGADVTASWTGIAGTSLFESNVKGLKELVRFQFDEVSGAATEHTLYRMLQTVWYNTPNP